MTTFYNHINNISEELVGQIFQSVTRGPCGDEGEGLLFDDKYQLCHHQDCCEGVYIEDICGDLKDLENTPILLADCRTNYGEGAGDDSVTWTFFEFRTIKGSVTVRFYGTSNGYYSETANLYKK